MDSITTRTVTLTRAAHAAGMPVRVLRRAALSVPLLGQPGHMAGAWRRYSALDCVRLAVVGRLVDFGIILPAAVDVLEAGVDRHLMGLALCGVDLPASFLTERLAGLTVHVAPGPDGLDIYAAPRRLAPEPCPAALILDIGSIAADAIARLDVATTRTVPTDTQRSTGPGRAAQRGAEYFTTAGTPPAITPEITP